MSIKSSRLFYGERFEHNILQRKPTCHIKGKSTESVLHRLVGSFESILLYKVKFPNALRDIGKVVPNQLAR